MSTLYLGLPEEMSELQRRQEIMSHKLHNTMENRLGNTNENLTTEENGERKHKLPKTVVHMGQDRQRGPQDGED